MLLSMVASAHDFEVDGIYYNIINQNEVEVTYKGSDVVSIIEYFGDVNIPSTVAYNSRTYSVTAIGRTAFCGCNGLTGIQIPNSITVIGNQAFSGCTGLTCISIPSSVTTIEMGAFNQCRALTSITIPSSVTYIGVPVFSFCNGLSSINVESGNAVYDSRENCNAIIETTSNTLIGGCKNTIIPNTVISIGNQAFNNCDSLTSITIPNSVIQIGNNAFARCRNLNNVIIPNSVTSIGSTAFSTCSALTSIAIPNSVTSIGDKAFFECSGLTDVYSFIVEPSLISMGNNVFGFFYNANYSERTLHVPVNSVEVYRADTNWEPYFGTIKDMDNETLVFEINKIQYTTISDTTVKVSGQSYWEDSSVPISLNPLGFLDIDIPNYVTYNNKDYIVREIGDMAFYCNASIQSDEIDYASVNYNLYLPKTITFIGNNAFGGSYGLANIFCSAKQPPIVLDTISNHQGFLNLFVSSDAYALYQEENCKNQLFNSVFSSNGEESQPPQYNGEYLCQPMGAYGCTIRISPKENSYVFLRQIYNYAGLFNHIYTGEWNRYDANDSIYFFYESTYNRSSRPGGWMV